MWGGSEWEASWYPCDVQFLVASKALCAGCTLSMDALTRPTVYDLRLLTIGFLRATSQLSAALVIRNRKIGHSRHYILFVSFRNLHNIRP